MFYKNRFNSAFEYSKYYKNGNDLHNKELLDEVRLNKSTISDFNSYKDIYNQMYTMGSHKYNKKILLYEHNAHNCKFDTAKDNNFTHNKERNEYIVCNEELNASIDAWNEFINMCNKKENYNKANQLTKNLVSNWKFTSMGKRILKLKENSRIFFQSINKVEFESQDKHSNLSSNSVKVNNKYVQDKVLKCQDHLNPQYSLNITQNRPFLVDKCSNKNKFSMNKRNERIRFDNVNKNRLNSKQNDMEIGSFNVINNTVSTEDIFMFNKQTTDLDNYLNYSLKVKNKEINKRKLLNNFFFPINLEKAVQKQKAEISRNKENIKNIYKPLINDCVKNQLTLTKLFNNPLI